MLEDKSRVLGRSARCRRYNQRKWQCERIDRNVAVQIQEMQIGVSEVGVEPSLERS